jgi:uncharacterized membrane protein
MTNGADLKEHAHGFWGPLAYFLPIVGPVIVLLARKDSFSRFHAIQSILATVAFILVALVLWAFSHLPIFGFLYGILFIVLQIGIFVLWVFLMYKAWQGDRYKLPYIGEWAAGPEDDVSDASPPA